MKNYKLLTTQEWGLFGPKKVFTQTQAEALKELGFRHDEFFNAYKKSYCEDYTPLEMCLYLGKDHLCFYYNRDFILPCQLPEQAYKLFKKVITSDIRKLKELCILK